MFEAIKDAVTGKKSKKAAAVVAAEETGQGAAPDAAVENAEELYVLTSDFGGEYVLATAEDIANGELALFQKMEDGTFAQLPPPEVDTTQPPADKPDEPEVVVPAQTYDEAQQVAADRIALLPERISKIVAVQGGAALDAIEHFLSTLEA